MPAEDKAEVPQAQNMKTASGASSVEEVTRRNVERIQTLEAREHSKATTADRVADVVTNFVGSVTFVWITVVLVGGWVIWNLTLP